MALWKKREGLGFPREPCSPVLASLSVRWRSTIGQEDVMRSEVEVYAVVVAAFCEALGLDEDEVERNSRVIDDLGAESLDFLDIAFRLERALGIKIPRGQIQKIAEQKAGEAFEDGGKLTEAGASALREALPEVPSEAISAGFPVRDIPRLFTVETFLSLVMKLLYEQQPLAS